MKQVSNSRELLHMKLQLIALTFLSTAGRLCLAADTSASANKDTRAHELAREPAEARLNQIERNLIDGIRADRKERLVSGLVMLGAGASIASVGVVQSMSDSQRSRDWGLVLTTAGGMLTWVAVLNFFPPLGDTPNETLHWHLANRRGRVPADRLVSEMETKWYAAAKRARNGRTILGGIFAGLGVGAATTGAIGLTQDWKTTISAGLIVGGALLAGAGALGLLLPSTIESGWAAHTKPKALKLGAAPLPGGGFALSLSGQF